MKQDHSKEVRTTGLDIFYDLSHHGYIGSEYGYTLDVRGKVRPVDGSIKPVFVDICITDAHIDRNKGEHDAMQPTGRGYFEDQIEPGALKGDKEMIRLRNVRMNFINRVYGMMARKAYDMNPGIKKLGIKQIHISQMHTHYSNGRLESSAVIGRRGDRNVDYKEPNMPPYVVKDPNRPCAVLLVDVIKGGTDEIITSAFIYKGLIDRMQKIKV